MSNFKSGSGNLDFGGDNEKDEQDEDTEETETQTEPETESDSSVTEQSQSGSLDPAAASTAATTDQLVADNAGESAESDSSTNNYPYFVRRNNVGDERDTRLEIHVRDKIADQEPEFRNELAEQLETNEIAKTDAREFALLAAFQHPERVAELMRDEGFGTLD